ncbi:4-hydroxybenzoyl-CoA thioesterase family active site [hydrothermal vent metagenome]|uniref:4-hydroxybenzoyl-CoA thioesterase family active site n=1 Tax=hydrothermal vent metagenome TaxID=652676 RepID=A0A1W1CDR3_9ZZZZ
MNIRVYYEDTDAGGIVYHTNYIKYCERARSELFFEKNMTPTDGKNSGFVVRNISANFLGMAHLGDMLEVKTKVIKKKSSSLILKQSIFSKEKKIFEMDVTLVFVRDGKPTRIPEHLIDIIIPKKV